MRGGEGRVVETRDEIQSDDISRNNELLSRVRSAGEEGCGSRLADVLEWGVDNRQNGGKELSESEEHNATLNHDASEEPIPQWKLPRNLMVLQRDNPTLLEKDTPSVLQMGAPMILQRGTPLVLPRDTSIQRETPMVLQRDTPLVLQKDAPMILPKDTPIQRETLIVLLKDTPMVLQRDTLIVLEKDTPMVQQTDTPIQRETPKVLQRDTPIILQRETPMVLQRDTPIILQRDTPMVLQRDTPIVLLQRDTPRVLQRDTPMVLQRDTPIVLQKDNPMILQRDTPIVLQSDTPTIQRESPLVQQKDTPTVQREGFLPHCHLRVLLVEDDDSTRHVVNALLRNCSYEVTCACDGLEAWQLLKNQESRFDLVLTEVVMPNLSGIDLLCKIMTHKSLKCIPVIMMSSHDSMGIVFKCLSKGAADFLVKPVRKNELKNLWQHVWRRCHSSSGGSGGGGSEQAQNVPQPDSAVAPENSGGSSDRNDNVRSGLNIAIDSRDKGSGTQRSWVKREAGIDIPWERSSQGCSKSQGIAESERHHTVPECNGLWKDVDFAMGQGDFEIAASSREGDATPQYAYSPKALADLVYATEHTIPSIVSIDEREKVKEGDSMAMGPSAEAVSLINSIAYKERETEDWHENRCRVELSEELLRTKVAPDLTPTLLELPPNHSCSKEERITLRHSGNSAFSRYISRNFTPSFPAAMSSLNGFSQMVGGYIMGCSTANSMGSSIPTEKVGSSMGSGKGSAFAYPFQQAINDHEKTSGQDASLSATTTIKDEVHLGKGHSWPLPLLPFPSGMLPPCEGISRVYGPMHPTMFYPHFNTPCWTANSPQVSGKAEVLDHRASHEHTHHHQQHHHHNHQHISANTSKTNKQEEHTMTHDGACGSRCKGPKIDNGESGSGTGNGSATGSSNVNDSDNTIVFDMGGTGRIADSPKHVDCGSGIMASNVGISPDQSRIMRREAALTKFRQKRKERCFDKKVRYQSRKRLAEQRPRVRGQFVRQCENNIDLS